MAMILQATLGGNFHGGYFRDFDDKNHFTFNVG